MSKLNINNEMNETFLEFVKWLVSKKLKGMTAETGKIVIVLWDIAQGRNIFVTQRPKIAEKLFPKSGLSKNKGQAIYERIKRLTDWQKMIELEIITVNSDENDRKLNGQKTPDDYIFHFKFLESLEEKNRCNPEKTGCENFNELIKEIKNTIEFSVNSIREIK